MKISGLKIDGFGVWTGLNIEGLSDGLNVLYGPNEAGKTTLLQFIRSSLYGYSPARRRYFPPRHGGQPGGSIDLGGPNGRYQLRRHADANDPARGEQLALVAADGTLQGEHLVKTLLCDVDEATYNNVFAVGLQEMQQLGTLSDTEAAELLYGLTAGLDRVSLVEVMRELETSRNRVLDALGGPSQVTQLLQQREQLRAEIEELGKLTRHFNRLAAEQNQLQREVARLEEESHETRQQARVFELTVALRERWDRRAALDRELAVMGPSATLPAGAVDRLDALVARIQKNRDLAEAAQQRREQLRAEAGELAINDALWRQAARIETLAEQGPWIASLRSQADELQTQIARIESDLAVQQQQLGLGDLTGPEALAAITPRRLSRLRPAGRAIRRSRDDQREAEQQAAAVRGNAESLSAQITAALGQRGRTDLAAALDEAGSLAAQLRRRVQIDERLDQMAVYQTDLEQQSRRLLNRQLLPLWVLVALGAVFVVGVVLVMAGLFMPASITGSVGWVMALMGLGGSGLAAAGKVMLERSNARQLENCQKHLSMLQLQLQQGREQRDALDAQLPRGSGPVVGRLQAAERELASLEELVPLDARRTAAVQEAQAAAQRVARAKEQVATATRGWRDALNAAGLPERLTPKQVHDLSRRCDQIGQMCRRLADRRDELSRRRRELESLGNRIAQLATDAQMPLGGSEPVEQLRQLAEALRHQETLIARRRELGAEARRLRAQRAKHQHAVNRLRSRRRELLREAGAQDERQFRQRAVEAARAEVLRQQRATLAGEIGAALAGVCSEETIARQLDAGGDASLEARRGELVERLDELDKALKQRFQQRGRLDEQMKTLAENRESAAKRLELATVEKRLAEALARWRVLAVTHRALDVIRTTYEKERQPETLQEASGYLDRLTQGRYCRVWTPLGENVLRVDDAQGDAHAVESLSRGTREQLFLSLRLALVGCYARRGAPLPLVLDDVLVNFDAGRAKAAAAVLRDFAAAGHQVLVFTCHEHMTRLFRAMKVPVSQLPDNSLKDHAALEFEPPPSQAKAKAKRAKEAAAAVAEANPTDDEIEADDTEEVSDGGMALHHPDQPSPREAGAVVIEHIEDEGGWEEAEEEDDDDESEWEEEGTGEWDEDEEQQGDESAEAA